VVKRYFRHLYEHIVRSLPLAGGQTILGFNRLTRWAYGDLPSPQIAYLLSNVEVPVDPQDYHGRILLIFGTGDIKVGELAATLTRPGESFVDIGANYGSIGLAVAKAIGDSGDVHLVEPQPTLAKAIQHALDNTPQPMRAHVHPIGLSDQSGTMLLQCASNHSGLATLTRDISRRGGKALEIQVFNIDDFLNSTVSGLPVGFKVDVEGYEPVILPAIAAFPTTQFIVFEACNNPEMLYSILVGSGHVVYGICRTYLRRRLRRLDSWQELLNYHDAVSFPKHCLAAMPRDCSFRCMRGVQLKNC
jgi:FkbM family methyltransferase